MKVAKMSGRGWWSELSDSVEIRRAILRNGTDLVFEGGYQGAHYDVSLRRIPRSDQFHGEFKARQGGNTWSGPVRCRVYTSGRDMVVLGSWTEEAYVYEFVTELASVDKFDDEE
jgi:hypothetical protein